MTNFRIKNGNGITTATAAERKCWIDVIDPARRGARPPRARVPHQPRAPPDVLDIDEQARIEKEDDYTLLIVRLPVLDAPLRAALLHRALRHPPLLGPDRHRSARPTATPSRSSARARPRASICANKSAFVLHLLGRAAIVFLRYLKEINRRTSAIERELQRSVKNHELTQLLSSEKSLVFFTTSLKSNEILLEKLQATQVPSASRRTRPSSSRTWSPTTSRPSRWPTSTRTSSRA